MVSAVRIALAYTLFAVLATAANLGSQMLTWRVYAGPYALMVAIAIGTGVGLILKYVLDKHYIFRYFTRNAAHEGRTFVLYTLTGVATTLVFWGFELGFEWIFGTARARYTGAVLGLAIGYVIKYQLDRRHVFREAT